MVGLADFCVSCAASIARDLVCGATRQVRYCCRFNKYVKELQDEKAKLLKYKERVNDHAEREKRKRAKKIDEEDKDWLEDADSLLERVNKLEAKVEKYKNHCLVRCPNCICRYLLGRQSVKLMVDVKQLCDRRPLYRGIDRLFTLPGIEYSCSEDFMQFKSRQSAREQLMGAIKDDEVSMIGLHGMGGSGKTTLAKEVGKEAEQLLHYKVAFVVVSRNEVRTIQDKIARSIRFTFPEEATEREKLLSVRLGDGEKILIILDDVWGWLDFKAIGIPFGENRKGCKVLITTRSFDVCILMRCQEKILLSLLSFDESWALFKYHAQITDGTSTALKLLAEEITRKCDRLPVAIAAVASTLKGKHQVRWEVALKTLEESRLLNIEEGLQNPYKCLQLSYENLKCQETKSLFLLCSAFPEDTDIPVEILTRFAIALGLFGKVRSYTMARKQVIAAKHELINACLLLEGGDDEDNSVKMHDLVRDVALYLADGKIKLIKGNDGNENALEEDNRVRYLWCDKFPNQLSCSELEFLVVECDSEIVEEPNGVFQSLKNLPVLALILEGDIEKIPELPNSMEKLTNMRCLVLVKCQLGHISFLKSMKGLESLTLFECTFHEFPDAIVYLTKLKLLHVTGCEIERSPYEVIGRCSQIQELYFNKNVCPEWSYADETAAEFLENFNAPQALQRYQIGIGDSEEGHDILEGCTQNILAIEYFVASISNSIIKDLVKKAEVLSLGHMKGDCKSIVPDIYQKVGGGMSELIELTLHNSEEIKYLIDNTEHQCKVETVFSKLSELRIREMHHLEALCHGLPSPALFEKLKKISISECSQLHGVLFIGKLNLCNLEVLELGDCPKLTSLFTPHSAQSLLQLQDLTIYRCGELKHIITEEAKEIIEYNDQRIKELPFQRLKKISIWECGQLHGVLFIGKLNLRNLEELRLEDCPKLTSLFTPHSAQSLLQLRCLTIETCSGLKHILTEEMKEKERSISHCNQREQIIANEEHDSIMNSGTESCPKNTSNCCTLHSDCDGLKATVTCQSCDGCKKGNSCFQSQVSTLFPKLEILDISDCNSLEYMFPVSFNQGLMQLKNISIRYASQLEYLFGEGNLEHRSSHQNQNIIQFELPVLEHLTLQNLPNLIGIFPGNYHVECSSLQEIWLEHVGLSNTTSDSLKDGSKDRQWDYTSTKDLGAAIRKLLQNSVSNTVENSNSDEHFIGKEKDVLSLREVRLGSLHEIRYLCMDPTHLLNLQNLLKLSVKRCGKLKAMFSVSVLSNLSQLKKLIIIECEELEQITVVDQENDTMSNPFSQKVCFPQLEVLFIKRCNKLKRLFSISTSGEFPKLRYLIIKETSQLEQVFERERGETEESKENVLPELKLLVLVQLPSLTNVWQGIEFQTVIHRVVRDCPNLSSTTSQKISRKLIREIYDVFDDREDLAWDLEDILETSIEDSVVGSELSDSEDEASSGSEPTSSQIIKEKGKGIVGNGSASRTPTIATSSTDDSMDEKSTGEPTLIGQQLTLGGAKQTTKVPQEISISSDQSVEAIPHESAKEYPTSKEDVITTFSDDLALSIGSLQKASAQELMNTRNETIMTNQEVFGEMKSNIHSNALHNSVTEAVLEDCSMEKAYTMTLLTDLEPELVKMDSIRKPIVMEQQAIGTREVTNNASNTQCDPVKNVIEPDNNSAPNVAPVEIAMETSSIHPLDSSRNKVFSQNVEAMVKESAPEGPSSEEATIATWSNDLAPRNSPPIGSLVIGPLQKASHLGVVNGVQEGLPTLKAIIVASSSQATEGNESTNNSTNSVLGPAQNEPKLRISSPCPSVALSDKTFSQISSNLAQGPSSSTSTILLAKLSGKGGVDKFSAFTENLECSLFESCVDEYAIDVEIQQLIVRKMEILEQRNSLASQLNQSTEIVRKDYAEWKALRDKLKVSIEKWLKLKEDLARANASWKLFKETKGL